MIAVTLILIITIISIVNPLLYNILIESEVPMSSVRLNETYSNARAGVGV
jgi:hypothetical protein